ncbi:MAG: hypothetical protein IT378_13880 [Sandaracinaceae bacterium]|nr:hypothetical protein [Sandaracinaceae bacterium]
MDIWRWVTDAEARLEKEGEARLAHLMRIVPHLTCEDRHAEVDAVMPEALALARARRDPWIEVFLRHWHLQSRVLHRHEVEGALAEAVALLEYASREESRGCPQSVCCTQDLAACYADLDGPGYAQERLAVSAETLSRIDPTWPCFDCISAEHASALGDAARQEDRLAFLEEQTRALARAGKKPASNIRRQTCESVLDLGRHEEGLALARKLDSGQHGKHGELDDRSLLARALASNGQGEEGARVIAEPQEILHSPSLGPRWIDAVRALIGAGAYPNDWRLGRTLRLLHDRLRANGALFPTAWVATHAAELAVARGAREVARLAIRDAKEMLPKLRKPELLRERVERAAADAERIAPKTGLGPDVARAILDEGGDPEQVVDWTLGDGEETARVLAEALERLGSGGEAVLRLQSYLRAHPDASGVAFLLADLWRERGALEDLEEAHRDALERGAQEAAYFGWRRALATHEAGRIEEAEGILAEVTSGPAPLAAFVLRARWERERGEVEAALERLDRLAQNAPAGELDWERMICATLLGRHATVRASAARLGMDFGEGDGPIEAPGPLCRLRITEGGRARTVFAFRSGPVTARVVELTGAEGEPERFDDLVVFEARPDNPDAEPEAGRAPVFVYPALATIEKGGFASWRVEGLDPGPEATARARDALRGQGFELQVLSSERYRVTVGGERRPALFALVGAARAVPPSAVSAALRSALEGAELYWPELAREAGDGDLDAHRAGAERLGLSLPD